MIRVTATTQRERGNKGHVKLALLSRSKQTRKREGRLQQHGQEFLRCLS